MVDEVRKARDHNTHRMVANVKPFDRKEFLRRALGDQFDKRKVSVLLAFKIGHPEGVHVLADEKNRHSNKTGQCHYEGEIGGSVDNR